MRAVVTSPNGHVKHPSPERAIISAEPAGAFFCITYGPIELAPAQTILKVYYTADMGRELFRVEQRVPKQSWLSTLLKWVAQGEF